jgi:hypothetical protein
MNGEGRGVINLSRVSRYVTCVHQPSQKFAQRTDATVQNTCNVSVAPRHQFVSRSYVPVAHNVRTHTHICALRQPNAHLGLFVSLKCMQFLAVVLHLSTPWSRFLLEKLTVNFAASQGIPRIYGTRKFLTVPTSKCPPPVPILSQLQPVPTTPSNFLKIRFNIILPATSWSPQWPLSLRPPHQHPVHTSVSVQFNFFWRINYFFLV